jgi:hypothetical protein
MAEKGSTNRSSNGRSSANSKKSAAKDPTELARTAVRTLVQLTGRQPEAVLGLRKEDDGWQVLVEVVEMQRIPNSTDLLGCYAVSMDQNGDVVGYERQRRYQRGQTGGE